MQLPLQALLPFTVLHEEVERAAFRAHQNRIEVRSGGARGSRLHGSQRHRRTRWRRGIPSRPALLSGRPCRPCALCAPASPRRSLCLRSMSQLIHHTSPFSCPCSWCYAPGPPPDSLTRDARRLENEGRSVRDGPGRTRTSDTRFRKPVLYPLSYEAGTRNRRENPVTWRPWHEGVEARSEVSTRSAAISESKECSRLASERGSQAGRTAVSIIDGLSFPSLTTA